MKKIEKKNAQNIFIFKHVVEYFKPSKLCYKKLPVQLNFFVEALKLKVLIFSSEILVKI
jgi:hypothetical protein